MAVETARAKTLTSEEIVALTKKHTIFEWSAQSKADPIPVAGAKGCWFWTPEGKRYLDFNSQLMCVNIGHGDERVVRAIQEQAETLPYVSPFMATEPRARLGQKLAEIAPGDIGTFFFTNGGADANENAIKIARQYTGRFKILARYRSYHGGTMGAASLTGDPRRLFAEPGLPGVIHVLDPYHGVERGWETADEALDQLDEIVQLEGPSSIAAFILEPVTGTNGILIPPDGYLQGVRELCTKHGILMICDEVMSGFGRTGAWFAVNHWNVVPDIITMAKGLTSAYVQLGAVGMRPEIAKFFQDRMFPSGLTYNSHPLACAAALATLAVYEEDDLIGNARRMGVIMKDLLADLERRHERVGAVRSIGLFGIVELVKPQPQIPAEPQIGADGRRSRVPLAPFGGTSDEMQRFAKALREEGLYTFVRWHTFFTNPPLCITESELREGFAMIDRALAKL